MPSPASANTIASPRSSRRVSFCAGGTGSRDAPRNGEQASYEHHGRRLRQWQWEIDRRARVKVAVGQEVVVMVSASTGHPKEKE